MEFQHQSLEVNGIQLKVVIAGEGPPVVLLHGFPDSAYLWRNQIPDLVQSGYRVIAPDLRGFGESEAPADTSGYAIDIIAKDVTALMDLLAVDRAAVVGHDWGAVLGWVLAIRHPERVDRLVALSVGHPAAYRSDVPGQYLRAWYALAFQMPFLAEQAVKAFDWRFLRTFTENHPEMPRWTRDLARPGRLTAGLNWYRANILQMLLSDFPPARVPVMGIWSTGDRYLTEGQMIKSAAFVDATWRYVRLEGVGHWIPLGAPERLNHLLLGYLYTDNP